MSRGDAAARFVASMRAPVRTFLFTDIEGSSRLWERHPEVMPRALAEHDAILQQAVERNHGRVFKTAGDAVCAVFDSPIESVRAAVEAQRALFETSWEAIGLAQPLTVRMALQAGEAEERDGDFSGLVLNRISRLLGAGHGGQVLVAPSVADDLQPGALPGVGLRDFGERRLRDVPGANRIYQLEIDGLRISFPPLETLDTVTHNLPVSLNACLDRESELAQIRLLLLDSPSRVVTLLGPGGIGKTRLALHAAMGLIDAFSGGVWFVDLSGVRDGMLAPAAVASVLGERGDPGSDPVAAIAAKAGERKLLLILDNCEQIVEGVARLVAALLPRAGEVRVLATSRVPLQIRGEQRVEVGPLPVEFEEAAGPAVQLFLERAQQIRPSLELTGDNREAIYEICHRVDGIPLALELAAARVAVLSPEALRTRLTSRLSLLTSSSRDVPERHQTLRAAIAWSYALLTEEEQRVFRALAVFQGGWSFAAAQAVLGLDELATMDVLASLRDKSLVRLAETGNGEARYSMLETIQEFGVEQLALQEEVGTARSAHADYYAMLSGQAELSIEGGPQQKFWLEVIDWEIGNLRAAMETTLEDGDPETTLEFAMNLWAYWPARGLTSEGKHWFERTLNLTSGVDPIIRARALRRIGHLCVERGELRVAESLYQASLDLERRSASEPGIAASLSFLGMVAGMRGRDGQEYECQVESLVIWEKLGHVRGQASSLLNLAIWARNLGKTEQAQQYFQQTIELQLSLVDDAGVAFSHALLARLYEDLGEFESASTLLDRAESVFLEGQIDDGLCLVWLIRSSIEMKRGNLARAEILTEEALRGYGARGDKVLVAAALEMRAAVASHNGDTVRGAEALGAAHYLREVADSPAARIDIPGLLELRQRLQMQLGERIFALHWELGRQHQVRSSGREPNPAALIESLELGAGV